MKKSDLKEGMQVINIKSGSVGEVRDLRYYADRYVSIRRRTVSGKNKGKYIYVVWNVENLKKVS